VTERTNLVQGAGKSDQSVATDAPIGGLETDDATERSRLTDGTTGIGTDGSQALASRHSRCTATGATSGHMVGVPWVRRGAEGGCLRGSTHGELIEIRLPEQNRSGLPEAIGHRGLVGRDKLLEHPTGTCGANAARAEVVLDRQRDSGQGRQVLTGCTNLVNAIGIGSGPLRGDFEKGMNRRFNRFNPGQVMIGEFPR